MSERVQPKHPIFIPSKGRWESRLTFKSLDRMGVFCRVIVEEQELEQYASVIPRDQLIVLDPGFQERYDTFDRLGRDHGVAKGRGPGPARNFAWDVALREGAAWHWVMDDNIDGFYRRHDGLKTPVADGAIIRAMEDFVERYLNVAMAGPNYFMFGYPRLKRPPFILNTRIYSCNLIRNDVPFRWRGRYNEDTDLSLQMMKAGWCTVQFNAFLQNKINTQLMKGGNTDTLYTHGDPFVNTYWKSLMLERMHPDCARMSVRYGRVHHHVDYKRFKQTLRLRPGVELPNSPDEYGMRLEVLDPTYETRKREKARARQRAVASDAG